MKLNCHTYTVFDKMKSSAARRALHVVLSCVAIICLILALSPAKKHAANEAANESVSSTSLPKIAAAEKSAWPDLKANLAGENTKVTSETKTDPKDAQKNAGADQNATNNVSNAKDTAQKEEKIADLKTVLKQDYWQTIKIRPRDTLAKIFARQGFSKKDLHAIMKVDTENENLASLQPGQTLKLKISPNKQINGLTLDIGPGDVLNITRDEKIGFQADHKQIPLEKQLAFGKGTIQNSLSVSAKKAGLDHKVVAQLVDIFGWNIDFASIRPNDSFRVLFEEKFLEGERIDTGHVLAAEIVTNGKKHQAVRYTDHAGKTGYFAPDGNGMHQAFLRYPVNFTRISSSFGNRFHPILHKMREHKGVDFSAPKGTPVQTTADGKVIFAGTRRGYGKVIEIQHAGQYSTLYAHLSRIGVKQGAAVKQGQVIGNVGATGLATGPHLHYEFRVAGIHRDPTTVSLPRKSPISDKQKPHFIAHAKQMLKLMDLHESKVEVARNEFPHNE